jgi:hypothetical protein
MSPNTTPNAERLSAGRLEATTVLLWCKGALFDNADTFGRSSLPHFRSLLDKGRSRSATAGGRHRIPQSLGVWVITRLPPAAKPDVQPLHIRNARGDGVAHHHRNAVACPNQSRGGRSRRLCPSPHLMRNALKPSRRDQRKQFLSALKRLQEGLRDLRDVTVHEECLAATRLRRGTDPGAQKKSHACRILLQCTFDAIMCRSPNFARACGRVSIGRHPDKRPDSRLRLDLQPHYVIGSRRRNRRTPRSTGDAA